MCSFVNLLYPKYVLQNNFKDAWTSWEIRRLSCASPGMYLNEMIYYI